MQTQTDPMLALGKQCKRRYTQMCLKRQPLKDIIKLIGKYVSMREITFGDVSNPGAPPRFTVKGVSDDEVVEAARTAATALGGALWPHAGDSFELIPDLPQNTMAGDDIIYGSEENKKYAEGATKILRSDFDAPETNWLLAWSEHLSDQPTNGTSGVYGMEKEDDDRRPYRFRSVGITRAVIDEDADGVVNTVGLELAFTIRQLCEKYGTENCSERVQQKYNSNDEAQKDEYIKVIQLVQPRPKGKAGRNVPVDQKPWAWVTFEFETEKVLLNSGTDDLSIWMCRFRRLADELYGRSLCMDAIPTIRELNVLRLQFTKALEKILDPPVGYYSEAIGGTGKPDISAGAKVALLNGGRLPERAKAIELLMQMTEPRVANDRLEALIERVKSKLMIDRLLDFNNRVRMTAHETDLRDGFRNQALNDIFQRQMNEILVPAIKWAYMVRYRRGLIGFHPVKDALKIAQLQERGIAPLIIPQEIADRLDAGVFPFTIRFISPAARAMKKESLEGAERLTNYGIALQGAGLPGAMDVIEEQDAMRIVGDLCGAPSGMIRSKAKVKKIQDARASAMAKDQAALEQQQTAETAQKAGNAFASFSRGMNG